MVPVLIQLIDAACTQEAVQLVLGGTDVNERDSSGRSPLYAAVAASNLRLVELLLLKGADANAAMPRTGTSVLMRVLSTFKTSLDAGAIMVALIRGGADVTAQTVCGTSVFDFAVWCCVPEPLRLFLLMRGAATTALCATVVGTVAVTTFPAC